MIVEYSKEETKIHGVCNLSELGKDGRGSFLNLFRRKESMYFDTWVAEKLSK